MEDKVREAVEELIATNEQFKGARVLIDYMHILIKEINYDLGLEIDNYVTTLYKTKYSKGE